MAFLKLSDCGTQFASEFRKFALEYDFKHITSSPKYSQSNGAAEAAVKVAKSIIKKCKDDVNLGLLAYRTTPLELHLRNSCFLGKFVPVYQRYQIN